MKACFFITTYVLYVGIPWGFHTAVQARPANDPTLYPACPVNHRPEYYCCDYGNGEKYVYTLYHRPESSVEIGQHYYQGWNTLQRQINFPTTKYTPSTPAFTYSNDTSQLCRVYRELRIAPRDNNNRDDLVNLNRFGRPNMFVYEQVQCGEAMDAELRRNSLNSNVFMTYPGNPRNNNATCPKYATFTSLMDSSTRQVNQTLHQACAMPTTSRPTSSTQSMHAYVTYGEWPFLLVYVLYGLGFVLLLLWVFVKHSSRKKQLPRCRRWGCTKQAGLQSLEEGQLSLMEARHGGVVTPVVTGRASSLCIAPHSLSSPPPGSCSCSLSSSLSSSRRNIPSSVVLSLSEHERNARSSLSNKLLALQHNEIHLEETCAKNIQVGYQDSAVGTWLMYYVGFLAAFIHVLMVYFLLNSVYTDHSWLFGTPWVNDSEQRTIVFMYLFFIILVLYTGVIVAYQRARNFFRIECPLSQATYVYFLQPESSDSSSSLNASLKSIPWLHRLYARVAFLISAQANTLVASTSASTSSSTSSSTLGSLLGWTTKKGHSETIQVKFTLQSTRYIDFQHVRYHFDETQQRFLPASFYLGGTYEELLHQASLHLSDDVSRFRLEHLGWNCIEVKMPSIAASIQAEVLTYFYVYQLLIYYTTYFYKIWYMATLFSSIVCITAFINIYTKRKMQRAVVSMTHTETKVYVQRSSSRTRTLTSSKHLVPGDVVEIHSDMILPCDLVLIQGSVISDEAMLTGESMPVQKLPLPCNSNDQQYQIEGDGKKHTLFGGTRVISCSSTNQEVDAVVLAMVFTTGAHTVKGGLLQSILYPASIQLKYDVHLRVIVAFFFVLGVCASIYCIALFMANGSLTNKVSAFGYVVFMLAACVPPLLPVVITVGQVNAARRLQKNGINTLNNKCIALSGKVRVFCFDKTGTLTKQGLDFLGCAPAVRSSHPHLPAQPKTVMFASTPVEYSKEVGPPSLQALPASLRRALGTCHSVGQVGDQIVGNDVEVNMFQASGWTLGESVDQQRLAASSVSSASCASSAGNPIEIAASGDDDASKNAATMHALRSLHDPNGETYDVLKRYDFDHKRMTMSVLVRQRTSGEIYVYTKGSYEKILGICQGATLPPDYKSYADALARKGCYVLGVAERCLGKITEAEQLMKYLNQDQQDMEQDLSFLGLLLFRNELKNDTKQAIHELQRGDIRVVMITGDNAMCGAYVARQSGMISPTSRIILGDVETIQHPTSEVTKVVWKDIETNESFETNDVLHDILQEDLPKNESSTSTSTSTLKGKQAQQQPPPQHLELALTGQAFEALERSGYLARVLLSTRLFARMTPENKMRCVQMHMELGAITGMCGDGGNDCAALRQAHVGVALSDSEASVVSPFTSKSKTITSVVDLCREGRGSVATSFASVKLLLTYGLIGLPLRLTQYYYGIILSEWCWIATEIGIHVILSYFITVSQPLLYLTPHRPTSSLLGPSTLASMWGQVIIHAIFFFLGMRHLTHQVWYCPFRPDHVDAMHWWLFSDNAAATCIFYSIIYQPQIAALVYSFGSPFRRPVYTNVGLCSSLAALLVLDGYLLLGTPGMAPSWNLLDVFRIASSTNVVGLPDIPLPFTFRLELFFLMLLNVVCVIVYEYVFILGPVRTFFKKRFYKDRFLKKLRT